MNFLIHNLTIFGGQCLYSFDIQIDYCTSHTTEIEGSTVVQGGFLIRSKSESCVYPNAINIKDTQFTAMCSRCNQPPLTGLDAAPCGIEIGNNILFSMINSNIFLSESGLQLLRSEGGDC